MTLRTMRIYLDDIRPTPERIESAELLNAVLKDGHETGDFSVAFTHRCYTAQEAIELLNTGQVTFISFDHDLGSPENGTGYDVAKWIERAAYLDSSFPIPDYVIHSANPVGVSNIAAAMKSAMFHRASHGVPR